MTPEEELSINALSKKMSYSYGAMKQAGKTSTQIRADSARKVYMCAMMADSCSDDAGAWLCWMADAVLNILTAVGLTNSDLGIMMTKEETSYGMD